jgi:hypothetical protein
MLRVRSIATLWLLGLAAVGALAYRWLDSASVAAT